MKRKGHPSVGFNVRQSITCPFKISKSDKVSGSEKMIRKQRTVCIINLLNRYYVPTLFLPRISLSNILQFFLTKVKL